MFRAIILLASLAGAATPEQAFMAGSEAAMNKMMVAMSATSSGDVDVDFVNLMEPHHQSAIDMAKLQLKYGRNPTLRRLAQEIIVAQGQEIQVMRNAIGRPADGSVHGGKR